ncbi:MAG: hypothetical protein U0935_03420 [Pirellulales bacterium]
MSSVTSHPQPVRAGRQVPSHVDHVQKFGGPSVANPQEDPGRGRKAIRVGGYRDGGERDGDTTDDLIELANQITDRPLMRAR